jgi:hypothetical protein
MNHLRRATIGIALMTAAALAAFIYTRYFASPKLCVRVMAQQMAAKEKEPSPRRFLREQADLLDLNGATEEKLNEAWQKWITEIYAKNHSPAEATQWMEDFRRRWNCI